MTTTARRLIKERYEVLGSLGAGGEGYVVAMDWVEGTDLARLLRERGRPGLAPSSVLAYLAQAAEALTHLHST